MDTLSVSHQPSFSQLGLQSQPLHHHSHQRQQDMLFPHNQHGQRSAIDPDALAAAVQQYLPQHSHQHPPPPHPIPRHYPHHSHPNSHAFMQMNGQRPSSYISLPPGVDPSTVDFRTFYPYNPSEVKHRKRTTRPQLKVLEETFKKETKPNAALRKKLAAELEMTPRGVQVWFQNRRAKEKTLAKKAAVQGRKVIDFEAKGRVSNSPGGIDDSCEDGAEDVDEGPLDADEFETEGLGGSATTNGNYQESTRSSMSSFTSHFPPISQLPPPRLSDGVNSDSSVHAGGSSSGSQSQSLSKSTSPQSTPPEMTPPNDPLEISINVEGAAGLEGVPTSFAVESAAGDHQMQLYDHSDSQGYWGANGSCIPRAASRTPTSGFDPLSFSDSSANAAGDHPGHPTQESFLRRPSLPTHIGAPMFAREHPNMVTAGGAHRPPPYSASGNGVYARAGASASGFDPNTRRMSLERLAVHPYAYAAMQQNSTVYGPDAVANMGTMGPTTGMGIGRFRPTLPATTHSTPNGTPQARTTELPVPQSTLPSIAGNSGGDAMDISSAGSDNRLQTDLKLPTPLHSAHSAYQPESERSAYPKFDETGRMTDQLGSHSVVISPRTYEPPSAGPLPAADYSFGSVGQENGEGEQDRASVQAEVSPIPAAIENAASRTSSDSNSSYGSGMHIQQHTMVKPEVQESIMDDVLDPTSNSLTHHQLGSTVSFSSLNDGLNNASGNMYYRDNASSGFVPYGNYPNRFGSIVSIADTESSVTSGACFSSEAGSLMQPDQMSARPSSSYMEARRQSYTGQMMDMFSHLDVHNGSNASLPQSIESHSSHIHQHQNAMAGQSSLSVPYNRPSSEFGNPLPTVDERSPGEQSTRSSFSSPISQYSSQYGGLSFGHTNAPSLAHSATSSHSSLSLSIPPSLSPVTHMHSSNSTGHPYKRPSRHFHRSHQNRSHLRLDNTDKLDFLRADYDDVSGTGHYSPITGPQKDIFGDSVQESESGMQFAPCVPDDIGPMASSSSLSVHSGGQDMVMTSSGANSQAQAPYFGGYNTSKYSVNSYDSLPCSSSFHY